MIPGRRDAAAVFIVSLCLLALEIALARIFSVVMGYHFVFLIVSLAIFGGAAGALAALLFPAPAGTARARLARGALLLALWLLAVWGLLLWLSRSPLAAYRVLAPFHQPFFEPFARRAAGGLPGEGLFAPFAALALVAALPFAAGGYVAALALARWAGAATRVYALDLAGAGCGALGAVALLGVLDPYAALALLGALAAVAAALFASPGSRLLRGGALLLALAGAAAVAAGAGGGLVELRLVRGRHEPALAPVHWNAWSRVAAFPLGEGQVEGAWGVSRAFRGPLPEQRGIVVDNTGYTAAAAYRPGDDLAWARWNLLALPYLLRPEADALIIGPGGGRDILVAKAMGAARVRAVEVNPLVVRVVQEDLGEFTGRPYTLPGVETVVEEGRTYLGRDPDRHDVIAAALVYGPLAPAAGAFTFTEDHLATLEGFHALLGRLADGGVLALTRFASEPALLRLGATARVALEEGGVAAPAAHLFAAAERGLATLLVKQTPFTRGEALLLERTCDALGFEVLLSPSGRGAGPLADLLRAERLAEAAAALPLDVLPATDDRPFVNTHLRPADLRRLPSARAAEPGDRTLLLLRDLLAVAALLAALLLGLPLLARRRLAGTPRGPVLAAAGYFAALGLGFAVVEVVLVKRLLLLVGRPAPAIALALGALLVAGGIGSLRARAVAGRPDALRRRCALLTVGLLLAAVLLPAVVETALPLPLPARLAVAAAAAAAIGYFMGQPFPLGIALLRERDERLVPWAWSVSGALGAFGSVLALLLAVSVGYTEAMLVGPACYLVAAVLAELL